jgi:DNA ligase (NAD+)
MTRDEAQAAIEKKGGKVSSSVSRNTDYVVVGESPGSKRDKAEDFDIPILEEDEFLELMEKDDSDQGS